MPPVTVMIKPVSGACNMRCDYCFYADEIKRRDAAACGAMSAETLEILIRRVFAYAEGAVTLAFQGGEPTLAGAAFYERALALERKYNARRLPVTRALQTNGYAMSDDMLDILKAGDFLLGVSLDGTKALHDGRRRDALGAPTYDRVQDTLARIRQKGIAYNILCVTDARVALAARACFEALAPHRFLQFIPCMDGLDGAKTPDSLTAEVYGDFLVELFDLYEARLRGGAYVSVRAFDNYLTMLAGGVPEMCGMRGACSPGYVVEANGDVYPCDFYALDEWRLGNIKTQGFFGLSVSENALRFLRSSRAVNEACAVCEWRALCRGGCRRDRDATFDGAPGVNRLCAGFRRFFTARYGRLASLARWTAEHPIDRGAPLQGRA